MTTPEKNGTTGAPRARLYRWARCVCPRCHGAHFDLVPSDQPQQVQPHIQECDRCYLARLPAEARESYLRLQAALAPPAGAIAPPERPTQPGLPFGDGETTSTWKGPPGPWERHCEETRRRLGL